MAPGPPVPFKPRRSSRAKSQPRFLPAFLRQQSHRYSVRSKERSSVSLKQPPVFDIRTMTENGLRDTRPWLSKVRSALRLLIIVLSGSVILTLIHTLEIHRGNRFIDLRHGEIPMTWPARTNLAPTIVLFAVAIINFLASVAIMGMAFKRSFRRPIRSRDAYRIVAGSAGVILWATGLIVFNFIDKASKASLGHYACANRKVLSNGRYQYRAVCSEQGLAFYLAMGAACAEAVTLLTLGITALQSARRPPTLQFPEEKCSARYP